MAEEVKMEPVDLPPVMAGEPPKVNPLEPVKPAAPTATAVRPTLKTGATVSALRPGLKLPPKPGATVSALKPGLKLPPKPGATVSALKPGLKLPPKPGATVSALKPGLKLPPKPVIHKPGATVGSAPVLPKPLPKPVVPAAAPAAHAVAEKPAPVAPVKPVTEKIPDISPLPSPAPTVTAKPVIPVDVQGVGKLPTVAAPTVSRDAVADATPQPAEGVKPMEALKSVTQKLKGITQPIPQQAILRKTGIIAEGAVTEAQKEAAKHKTARISLSEAMGVAPVNNEHAPMKTIRIKRPVNIPTMTSTTLKPQPTATTASGETPSASDQPTVVKTAVATESPTAPTAAATQAEPATTITQRKTLKVARPGSTIRPTGKFGLKRPATQTATVVKTPAEEGAAPGGDAPVGEIADIPEIPPMPNEPAKPVAVDTTPAWLATLSTIVQAAAVVAIGALAWFLYQNTQIQYF